MVEKKGAAPKKKMRNVEDVVLTLLAVPIEKRHKRWRRHFGIALAVLAGRKP